MKFYLAALFEFLESEFVIVVLVHLIKDLLDPFLWCVLVLAERLLALYFRAYYYVYLSRPKLIVYLPPFGRWHQLCHTFPGE